MRWEEIWAAAVAVDASERKPFSSTCDNYCISIGEASSGLNHRSLAEKNIASLLWICTDPENSSVREIWTKRHCLEDR